MIGNYQSWFYRCSALLVRHFLRYPKEIENIKKDGLEAVREHSDKERAQLCYKFWRPEKWKF